MARLLAIVLPVVLALPAAALAQGPVGSRIVLTPTLGYRLGYSHIYDEVIFEGDAIDTRNHYSRRVEGDLAYGAEVSVRVFGNFHLLGGAMYAPFGNSEMTIDADGEIQRGLLPPGTLTLAKGGIAYALPERGLGTGPRSSLFLAFAHVRVKEEEVADPFTHYALNFGWKVEVPVPSVPLGIYIAVEDFVTRWDDAEFMRRRDEDFAREGLNLTSEISSGLTHLLFARMGLSLRI